MSRFGGLLQRFSRCCTAIYVSQTFRLGSDCARWLCIVKLNICLPKSMEVGATPASGWQRVQGYIERKQVFTWSNINREKREETARFQEWRHSSAEGINYDVKKKITHLPYSPGRSLQTVISSGFHAKCFDRARLGRKDGKKRLLQWMFCTIILVKWNGSVPEIRSLQSESNA